jgi:hypothetical protein
MKKFYSVTLVSFIMIASFSLQSCDKIKDKFFPGFEIEPTDIQLNIPVIVSTTAQSNVAAVSLHFNMDSIIKAETLNAFSIRNVDHISIQALKLTMLNADNENNFGNLENLSVSFHSNGNTNPVTVANAPVIADENTVELLPIPDVTANLRSYMNGDRLTYTLTGKARRVTTKPLSCTIHIRLKMK